MGKFAFFLLIFSVFTCCTSEKDNASNISVPVLTENTEFTLFPKEHVLNSDIYGIGEISQNQSDNPKFLLSERKWQGIPSIGKDRFGNLYVGYISGGVGESDDNYLTISLSKDKGRNWSHDKLVFSVNPADSTRMKDPNFFNDKFGNLYLYWGKQVKKKKEFAKEWMGTWYSKINLSKDGNSILYSPPRRIAEGNMMNKPFYSTTSDQLLFPIARWYEGNSELHQPFIYKANYGFKSLINFTKVGYIPLDLSLRGIYEHMVVELKDSTYLGMIRTKNGIYYSKSKDGNTWDKGIKFIDLGETPDSRFYLGRLHSGRLILIFNNSIRRANLTICLSDDEGLTWSHKMVLDARDYVSYPDMVETDPGILNIIYDYNRSPFGTIHFVEILEEDIVNNVNSNIFKTKVSTLK